MISDFKNQNEEYKYFKCGDKTFHWFEYDDETYSYFKSNEKEIKNNYQILYDYLINKNINTDRILYHMIEYVRDITLDFAMFLDSKGFDFNSKTYYYTPHHIVYTMIQYSFETGNRDLINFLVKKNVKLQNCF